jgi:hypothetical protein
MAAPPPARNGTGAPFRKKDPISRPDAEFCVSPEKFHMVPRKFHVFFGLWNRYILYLFLLYR